MSVFGICRSLLLGCAQLSTTLAPAQANHYRVLHSFNGKDGSYANGNLQLDAAGNLYGTTAEGGEFGKGTVFKLGPRGVYTVLHSFTGGADGGEPSAGLVIDPSTGDLFGTAFNNIFRINAAGDLTVLHTLDYDTDGNGSVGALLRDKAGNLYGTTSQGGATDVGTVFEFTRDGTFKLLSALDDGRCGSNPTGRLVLKGTDLYGVATTSGGDGSGSVFKVAANGTCSAFYSFPDGVGPDGGVARDKAGNFYGTKLGGSSYVYALSPSGTLSKLYTFTGGADGKFPVGDMLLTDSGKLYDVASRGGVGDNGTVFALDLSGTLTTLHSFTGAPADGAEPNGGLVRGSHGKFYGTTIRGGAHDMGIIFSVTKR
jgi:uncharacterized repeat protein (TIGR03803 family)